MKYLSILSPVVVFASTWLVVILLFSLRLSSLLEQSIKDAWFFYLISSLPFLLGYVLAFFTKSKVSTRLLILSNVDSVYYKRFFIFFYLFISLTIIEIIYSKGFPFLWAITGSGKSYFEYGIPSIHGLMNALELALGMIAFYFYKITKKRAFLLITIFFVIWNVLLITRQVIIVMLIEIFVIEYLLSKNRVRLIRRMLIYAFFGIIGFGILGDFRSGKEAFVLLASPTDNWPEWLPSGFLWVYIYVTTPLNNLLYNFTFNVASPNILFPNTMSLLFPSVIRNFIYDPKTYTVNGNLVTEAFNVSSAFSAPYTDMGILGIIIFSFVVGFVVNLAWCVHGIKKIFFHAIIIQILILSIFYNMFMYLPVVFQFVWIAVYFYRKREVETTSI